jgi:hypothetical protein
MSILLTIHAPSWYYQPAKKPAKGWSTVLKVGETYQRYRFSSK